MDTIITHTSDGREVPEVCPGWRKVVAFLSDQGALSRMLTTEQQAQVRMLADGFGSLQGTADTPDVRVADLLWDWSHVRDSSPEAVAAMAAEIDRLTAGLTTTVRHKEGLVDMQVTFAQARAMGINI